MSPKPPLRPHRPGVPIALSQRSPAVSSEPEPVQAAAPPPPDALLTPQQVAATLGVTVKVLERWRAQKMGPKVMQLTRRTLRYHAADVDAFIASHRPGVAATTATAAAA